MRATPQPYTEEQNNWIKENANVGIFKNRQNFVDVFNAIHGTNHSVCSVFTHAKDLGIKVVLKNSNMPESARVWIKEHSKEVYKNLTEFVNLFNAETGLNKTYQSIASYLSHNNIFIKTNYKEQIAWTDDMRQWCIDHYQDYVTDPEKRSGVNFIAMANDFNVKFGCSKTNHDIGSYCASILKIHTAVKNKHIVKIHKGGTKNCHSGMFQRGQRSLNSLPIGTIRYANGKPYIKVKERELDEEYDNSQAHSFLEPYWKPLIKKIWEDEFGEVPDGYCVVSLNRDVNEADINNLDLLNIRALGMMSKLDWWTDNEKLTKTGIRWCNLYIIAKDAGIVKREDI